MHVQISGESYHPVQKVRAGKADCCIGINGGDDQRAKLLLQGMNPGTNMSFRFDIATDADINLDHGV